MTVPWQCRNPACAWSGLWYACAWDGILHLWCPRCGAVCDPLLPPNGGGTLLERLLMRWSGALLVLVSLVVLWHRWDHLTDGSLASLARLSGVLVVFGAGLFALGSHDPPQSTSQQ
jgi:hypothetical protein